MTADSNQPNPSSDVAAHAIRGSAFGIGSALITLTLGLVRAVLLARLLLPEHFGVAALALFFLDVAFQLQDQGLDAAMLQRQEAGDRTRSTYITLRLMLVATALALLGVFAFFAVPTFYESMTALQGVLLAFVGIGVLRGLNGIQETLLRKDLSFGRIAIANTLASICMTIVAPYLAWIGWGVWSLVAERLMGNGVRLAVLWSRSGAWQVRPAWSRSEARAQWRFGRRVWIGSLLASLLDRFDNFWVGTMLGGASLGFYTRAHEFAGYPRRVMAKPLGQVFFPTFARLQDDRERLSKAFVRVSALMIRVGGWLALVLFVTAGEWIPLLLGATWRPMTVTFQVMLVYLWMAPLLQCACQLLAAVGRTEHVLRVRLTQAVIFLPVLVALSWSHGIAGAAMAVNIMMLIGVIHAWVLARRVVDYSTVALWFRPALALAVALGVTWTLPDHVSVTAAWVMLLLKAVAASTIYGLILGVTEGRRLYAGYQKIRSHILKGSDPVEDSD